MATAPAPIQVLQVVWSLQTGGLERVVLDLVRLSAEFNLKARVATLVEPGELAREVARLGIPLHHLGKTPGLDFSLVARLRSLVRSRDVQLIHAHNTGAAFYAGLAALASRRPLVTTLHGSSYEMDKSFHRLTRLDALMSRRVVCVSSEAREVSLRQDKVPGRKLRVIYNGVDLERFQAPPGRNREVRRELGLDPDATVVISVGRLSAEKDCRTLFQALALAARDIEGMHLLMVGDGPEREAYQQAAGEMAPAGRIRFLGNRRDVPRLLQAADIFALASLSEGVSIAILEAMAAGLPVAATAVGGTPEVVRDQLTGILVPPRRPRELARALAGLAADPARAGEMGRAGRELVERRFSLQAMVGAYAGLYREVLGT